MVLLSYLLARNPEMQEKLRDEVNRSWPKDGKLSYEVLSKMQILLKTFYETQRILPTVPRVPRWVMDKNMEFTVDGKTWPVYPGTAVFVNRFAGIPETDFNPFQWQDVKEMRKKIQPFLSGPRKCVGYKLSELETISLLALMLRRIRFSLPGGFQPPLKTLNHITLQPEETLLLK